MAEALSIPDSVRTVDAHAYRRHVVGFFALAAAECRGGQLLGGPVYHLIDLGLKEQLDDSLAIGKIIMGQQQGRTSDDDIICFIACGMSVFDLGLGYDLYQTALEKGIGTKLLLWENPAQCE